MKRILLLIILVFLLIGCQKKNTSYMPFANFVDNSKPVSYGNHQDVYVFSNQELDGVTAQIMQEQFGYPNEGAQKERTFALIWKDFDGFEEFKKAKNIMFIGNFDIPGKLNSFLQDKIPQDKLTKVMKGSPAILTYQNEWSDDQLVTFILAANKDDLENIILTRTADLYLDFEKRFLERMTKRVYYRGSLTNDSFSSFPFQLEIPSTFQVYKELKEDNLLSFIHRYKKKDTVLPDKFITVYYEKISKADFTEAWVKSTRNMIGNKILDGDKVDWFRSILIPKTFTTWNKDEFLGYTLEGAWENKKTKMGGSFKSYAFYDEAKGFAICIDTAVYYPAGTKIPFLTELEGIAKSYNIKEIK